MGFVAGAVCVSVVFALTGTGIFSAAQGAETDCKLHRLAHLDVTPDQADRPTVLIDLNGTPKKFVVDTAGVYSGVTPETVSGLSLKTATLSAKRITHTVSGESPTKVAYVTEMRIGRLPIPNMALFVMTPSMIAPDSDGLLSGEVLHVFDVEYDPAAAKLSLFQPNQCPANIVHWTRAPHAELDFHMNRQPMNNEWRVIMTSADWHIVAPAKLDGHDVDVTIDTGASTSFLLAGDADDLLSAADKKKMQRLDDATNPDKEVYSYPFSKLDLGPVMVENPKVLIFSGQRDRLNQAVASRPQLILGTTVLNRLHFYIDYKNHKIYLTPADAH